METPDFAIRSARPDADAPAEHAVVRRAFRAGPYGHLPVSEERAAFETALGWGAEALVLDTGRENLAAQRL